jgi:hypothetical protein
VLLSCTANLPLSRAVVRLRNVPVAQGVAPAQASAPLRGGYGGQVPQLSEAERLRSAAAVQQRFGGNPALANSIGARLLGKMGFGAAEDSKGGLGRNEHVSELTLSLVFLVCGLCTWSADGLPSTIHEILLPSA